MRIKTIILDMINMLRKIYIETINGKIGNYIITNSMNNYVYILHDYIIIRKTLYN